MKQYFYSIALTLALAVAGTAPVHAESTVYSYCAVISEFSEKIAMARYNGVPMRDSMDGVEGFPAGPAMVRDAYALPYHGDPEVQKLAVREYGNEIYELCVQVRSEDH